MRITKIELQHFRGVADMVSDNAIMLDDKLNVFYGVNGSGKTTVLDAVAYALSRVMDKVKSQRGGSLRGRDEDIQNQQESYLIRLTGNFENEDFTVTDVRTRKGYPLSGERSGIEPKEFTDHLRYAVKNECLPVFTYHKVSRNVDIRLKPKPETGVIDIYENPLNRKNTYRSFFEWFRNRDDIENENYRFQNGETKDRQLQTVRKAVSCFMPHFDGLTVKRSPLRMEVKKDGQIYTVDQLSDGEKCLMAMIGDIARLLATANPNNPNPLQGKGIILIDEIDLHLHPIWQHNVIPQLIETFPNCQFLISTHSPNVITHVKPQSIFALYTNEKNEIEVEHPNESYGRSAESIFRHNMGLENTRPDSVVKEIDTIYRSLDDGKLNEVGRQINSLREKIGNDPEIVRTSALLKRKEIIGK
jgi:predicted ATP-binding protein involved in virulence